MNFDKIDLVALDRDLQEYARQLAARNWWQRNWRWFLPVLLVAIVVLAGGGIYWSMFNRVYGLDVYKTAMEQIGKDKAVQEQLGEPIKAVVGWRPPNARIEATEKDVLWDIAGSKGSAKAHVFARLMQGKWEIVQMEVVLANGKRLSVAGDDDDEAKAPKFTPTTGEPKNPEPTGPAPEINLTVPPDDGPAK